MGCAISLGALRRVARWALLAALCMAAAEVALRALAPLDARWRALVTPRRVRGEEPHDLADLQRAFGPQLEPLRRFYDFRCNSLGFHDSEFLIPLPPATLRIAVLGDSFAHAMVPWRHVYLTVAEAELLQSALAGRAVRAGDPAPLELDNLGVPASGIEDYLWVYRLAARALRPDVVVVSLYMGNDLLDYADGYRHGPVRRAWLRSYLATTLQRMAGLAREQWTAGEPLATAIGDAAGSAGEGATPSATLAGSGGVIVDRKAVFSDDRPPLSAPRLSDEGFALAMGVELAAPGRGDPHDWQGVEAALEELVGTIELDDHRVMLALAPSRLQVHPDELADFARRAGRPASDFDPDHPRHRLDSYAARRRIAVIDLTGRLREAAAAGTRLYMRNDTHWNLAGNRIAGEELARRLLELGILEGVSRPPTATHPPEG